MNFLADESVDRQIVDWLRFDGHGVSYVAELDPGITDDDVLSLASKDAAVLLTADKDFGELVFRQRLHTNGIVLLRLAGLSPKSKAKIVCSAVRNHSTDLPQAFSVITHTAFRLRRLEPAASAD